MVGNTLAWTHARSAIRHLPVFSHRQSMHIKAVVAQELRAVVHMVIVCVIFTGANLKR